MYLGPASPFFGFSFVTGSGDQMTLFGEMRSCHLLTAAELGRRSRDLPSDSCIAVGSLVVPVPFPCLPREVMVIGSCVILNNSERESLVER